MAPASHVKNERGGQSGGSPGCLPLVIHCSSPLSVICHPLSIICHPSFIFCHSSSIVCHPLFVRLLSVAHDLLFFIHCPLIFICCLLFFIHCLCLSSIICCLSSFKLHSSSFISCLLFVIFCPLLVATSALKSSLKTAKRLQLDWTKTAKDQTCSLGLSVLRLEDCKKTGCGGPVLLVKTGLLYPSNNISKTTWSLEMLVLASLASLAISSALA